MLSAISLPGTEQVCSGEIIVDITFDSLSDSDLDINLASTLSNEIGLKFLISLLSPFFL